MGTIQKLRNLAEKLSKLNLREITERAVRNNDKLIIDLQKSQLVAGRMPEGNSTPMYSPTTLFLKEHDPNRRLVGDGVHYSLFDTSPLYNQMLVDVTNMVMTIVSTSQSAKDFDTFSTRRHLIPLSEYLGLSEDNTKVLLSVIIPEIQKEIHNGLR